MDTPTIQTPDAATFALNAPLLDLKVEAARFLLEMCRNKVGDPATRVRAAAAVLDMSWLPSQPARPASTPAPTPPTPSPRPTPATTNTRSHESSSIPAAPGLPINSISDSPDHRLTGSPSQVPASPSASLLASSTANPLTPTLPLPSPLNSS